MNIFSSTAEDHGLANLKPSHGEIPPDLNGVYLINGPGSLRAGERILDHFFDGFSYVHCFNFKNSNCSYQSRYLKTKGYTALQASGDIQYPLFSSVPKFKWYQYIREFFNGRESGNNSAISIYQMAGRYFALTESKGMSEFELKNLEFLGQFEFEDELNKKSRLTSAHPIYDPIKDEFVNFETIPGPSNSFVYFKINNKTLKRERVGEVSAKFLPYVHSFGLTKNYIIHVDFPLVVFPASLKIRFGWVSYANAFTWMPGPCKKSKISLINRASGNLESVFEVDPFFAFHHLNAFEKDGCVVFDICEYPSSKIIDNLKSETLLSSEKRTIEESAIPTRYRLKLDDHSWDKQVIVNKHMEMPIFNERNRFTDLNFYYGVSSNRESFDNSITKINVLNKEVVAEWSEKDAFAGQPVFLNKKQAISEDDGYILSLIIAEKNKSFLLCLNASDFSEVFRISVQGALVPSMHGAFFSLST